MRARTTSLVLTTALATAVAVASAPATAEEPPPWRTVASGLDNPRLLSWHGSSLYVAESGAGGAGPCVEGPEGLACLGASGAITRVTRHGQHRVVTGLPSLAAPDGSSATGPSDVQVRGRSFVATIGLGNDPAVRAQLGRRGRLFGTLVAGDLGRSHSPWAPAVRQVADLAGFEQANDPDGAGPDSNPTGLALTRHAVLVTDAGGNTLLKVKPRERHHRHHRHHSAKIGVAALFPAAPSGMQSVPTSVAQGPDGAWYVSQLTGFPFPPGGATVWRVVPGMPPAPYATGLTNVTDLAWHHGSLYAVQLSDVGLLNEAGLPTGSLVRVRPGADHEQVATGLPAPYGVALRQGRAYVTTCAVCAGGGSVVSVRLH